MLGSAQARPESADVQQRDGCMRHNEFVDTVLELELDTRLFVLGEYYQAATASEWHPDHHLERVIRAVKWPVLVATVEHFAEPERFIIAFVGSSTVIRMLDTIFRNPQLKVLTALVAICAPVTSAATNNCVQPEGCWNPRV
ncbi:MAG: hypothetical protein ACWGIK_16715 [Achromobacter pulmonis]